MLSAEFALPSLGARRAVGAYYTPPVVARFMCAWALRRSGHWAVGSGQAVGARLGRTGGAERASPSVPTPPGEAPHPTPPPPTPRPYSILDPAAGDGVFFAAMLDELAALGMEQAEAARCLFGVELRPEAARAARRQLQEAAGDRAPHLSDQIVVGDALLDPIPEAFDLVVGNPPYLGTRYFELLADPIAYRRRLRDAFGWTDDLYVHFIARSFELARPGGLVCLITPNTYLAAPSKRRLRELLLERQLLGLVLLGPGLFGAHVYPAILLARNAPAEAEDRVEFVDARQIDAADLIGVIEAPAWQTVARNLDLAGGDPPRARVAAALYRDAPDRRIFFPSTENLRWARLVEGMGRRAGVRAGSATPDPRPLTPAPLAPGTFVPLGAVAQARDAGIHSGNVRHRLFFREEVRAGLARLLQGSQIGRYVVRWDSPSARYRYVDLDYQPDPSRPGRGRGGRRSRHGEYWHFCGDRRTHEAPEKILVRQTEDDIVAAYIRQDDQIYYTDNTLFTVLVEPAALAAGISYLYLLGLLNSSTLGAAYHFLAQETGKAQAQVRVDYLNRLPILIPTPAQRLEVERLVGTIVAARAGGRVGPSVEADLDRAVEGWYGG